MRYVSILAAVMVCNLSCSFSYAQEQPIPTKSPSYTTKHNGPLTSRELIDLRIQMAESGYDLQKSTENFSTVVIGYEDMVSEVCMPELNDSLTHLPNPTEPTCRRYLDKLLELFPEDPVGVCARDGIDSHECNERFAYQQVDTYTFYDKNQPGQSSPLELDLKLALEKDRAQIANLQKEVNEAQLLFTQNKSASTRKSLAKSLYRYLGLQCRIVRTAIEERPRAEVVRRSGQHDIGNNQGPTPDPLLGYIDDKFGVKGSPTPTSIPLSAKIRVRVRYLANECLSALAQYGTIDPYLAAPICVHDGSISPGCIRARRIERKYTLEPSVRSHTSSGSSGGIVKF